MSFWYFQKPKLQKRFSFTWGLALVFIDYWTLEVTVGRRLFANHLHNLQRVQNVWHKKIAKGCLLTGQEQGCNRLTLLVGLVLSCPKWPKNRKMVVVCPIVITSIGDDLFQTRPGIIAKPVFCTVDTGSCFSFFIRLAARTQHFHNKWPVIYAIRN